MMLVVRLFVHMCFHDELGCVSQHMRASTLASCMLKCSGFHECGFSCKNDGNVAAHAFSNRFSNAVLSCHVGRISALSCYNNDSMGACAA